MNELNVSIENIPGKLESYQNKKSNKNMFILSQFYLFLEIKTRLSIASFYLCCTFRKPPE